MDPARWRRVAALLPTRLTVLDVGARAGVESQWALFGQHVRAYGFEPDVAECERLNRSTEQAVEYVPLALGPTAGEMPFYVTEDPFCSSLFPPIERLADERPRLAQMRTREVIKVHTQTIDEWTRESGIDRVDHLKLDAQGAELAILEGALGTLKIVRSVKLEVQFNQLYENVPLFGDVDRFLREHGFELWRLGELSHCSVGERGLSVAVPEILDYDSRRLEISASGGQLLWANAYYVRKETTRPSERISWDDAVRDACLAVAHHYEDLGEMSLRRASEGAPSDARPALMAVAAQ